MCKQKDDSNKVADKNNNYNNNDKFMNHILHN